MDQCRSIHTYFTHTFRIFSFFLFRFRLIQLSTWSVCSRKYQDTARSKMYCAQDVVTTKSCPVSLTAIEESVLLSVFPSDMISLSLFFPLFRRIQTIAYDYFRGLYRTLVSIITRVLTYQNNERPTFCSIFRKIRVFT